MLLILGVPGFTLGMTKGLSERFVGFFEELHCKELEPDPAGLLKESI